MKNVHLIAFEPIKENFKLLKINMILNDIADATAENFAVSDKEQFYAMELNEKNFGMCSIVEDVQNELRINKENVQSIFLDGYLKKKKINASEVKYIWIDTEGYEVEVLMGALNLLKHNVAIFMEFNPNQYNDKLKRLINILEEHYSGYIDVDEYITGNVGVKPIKELWNLAEYLKEKAPRYQADIF